MMTTFHYKAIDEHGKTVEGKLDANDKFALYRSVKETGLTVVSAKELKGGGFFSLSLSFLNGVTTQDKINFARNLGQMIQAGLPMTRALSIMENQAKAGQFKEILGNLNESLNKGITLSDSLKNYPKIFSTLFISMTRAGEESGNLAEALKSIGNQMEKTNQLSKKIKGALMYPSVIVCLMIIIGVLMMVYMVPTMTKTFVGMGVELPLPTRVIIATSNILQSYFIFILLGMIALAIGFIYFSRTKYGSRLIDNFLIHLPIIGDMVKQVNSARTARSLSSLLSSGVDIVLAISITKDVVQNSYYKEILDEAQNKIQKGEQISSIFLAHENLYPLFVGEMVSVGEETGKIGGMLQSVAEFYENEIDQKTKDMSSVIEPFLMIFIGLAVGLFALAIIGPIYSIGDSIN